MFKTSCVKKETVSVSINLKSCCVVTWTLLTFVFYYHWYVNVLCGGLSVRRFTCVFWSGRGAVCLSIQAKHVKVLFLLKIVALDGTCSLFICYKV
jgi:hypothetical protein